MAPPAQLSHTAARDERSGTQVSRSDASLCSRTDPQNQREG